MPSNKVYTGVGSGEIDFGEIVNLLHISVQNDQVGISLDNGRNYMTFLVGKHTINIGIIKKLLIGGDGSWQIIGTYEVERNI